MTCRSGCATKNHGSYAECLQASRVTIAATVTSSLQPMWSATKSDLAAYQSARRNGILPAGTSMQKVRDAEQASKLLGRPYNAESDPPANMIVNKTTARFVNTED